MSRGLYLCSCRDYFVQSKSTSETRVYVDCSVYGNALLWMFLNLSTYLCFSFSLKLYFGEWTYFLKIYPICERCTTTTISRKMNTSICSIPSEILFNPKLDDFEHPFYIKILLTSIIALVLISTLLVNQRLSQN